MKKTKILLVLGLVASTLIGCESNPPSNGVSHTVDTSQMPAYCRGMAAEKLASHCFMSGLQINNLPPPTPQSLFKKGEEKSNY